VRHRIETFLAEAACAGREGGRLPEFVAQEFRDFFKGLQIRNRIL